MRNVLARSSNFLGVFVDNVPPDCTTKCAALETVVRKRVAYTDQLPLASQEAPLYR